MSYRRDHVGGNESHTTHATYSTSTSHLSAQTHSPLMHNLSSSSAAAASAASPFRLSTRSTDHSALSPLPSVYRDTPHTSGLQIGINSSAHDSPSSYRTSCADCHEHVKELIRIHEQWQLTKKDLRESRRAHENLLKEYKDEVDATASHHQRTINGFHSELDALRADNQAKHEQLVSIRHESQLMQNMSQDLTQQLKSFHEKYAEAIAANSQLAVRNRELESMLTSSRLDRESAFDRTMQATLDELQRVKHDRDQLQAELTSRATEYARLTSLLELSTNELQRLKKTETKQTDVYEETNRERVRLTQAIEQQSQELFDSYEKNRKLQSQIEDVEDQLRRARSENEAAKTIGHHQEYESSQHEKEIHELRQQLRDLKQEQQDREADLNSSMSKTVLSELRRSRKEIETRISKLQDECNNVANMMSSPENSPERRGGGSGKNSARYDDAAAASSPYQQVPPDWLPPAVTNLITNFRHSLLSPSENRTSSISDEMSSFLIALNQIWRERMEDKLRVQRLYYSNKLREARRQLMQRVPYEQVTLKARTIRLQKNLDNERAVHLRTTHLMQPTSATLHHASRSASKANYSKGLLDLSLSTVENLSRQVLEYEQENQQLKYQLSTMNEQQMKHASEKKNDSKSNNNKSSHSSPHRRQLPQQQPQHQQLQHDREYIIDQLRNSLDSLGDTLWNNSGELIEHLQSLVEDVDTKEAVAKECQWYLDQLERNVNQAKDEMITIVMQEHEEQQKGAADGEEKETPTRQRVAAQLD